MIILKHVANMFSMRFFFLQLSQKRENSFLSFPIFKPLVQLNGVNNIISLNTKVISLRVFKWIFNFAFLSLFMTFSQCKRTITTTNSSCIDAPSFLTSTPVIISILQNISTWLFAPIILSQKHYNVRLSLSFPTKSFPLLHFSQILLFTIIS